MQSEFHSNMAEIGSDPETLFPSPTKTTFSNFIPKLLGWSVHRESLAGIRVRQAVDHRHRSKTCKLGCSLMRPVRQTTASTNCPSTCVKSAGDSRFPHPTSSPKETGSSQLSDSCFKTHSRTKTRFSKSNARTRRSRTGGRSPRAKPLLGDLPLPRSA